MLVALLTACGGSNEIVGTTWQWEAFQDTADINNVTVSDPENYTLTLNKDGTASIKADCNQVSWTYELDGTEIDLSDVDNLPELDLGRLGFQVYFTWSLPSLGYDPLAAARGAIGY